MSKFTETLELAEGTWYAFKSAVGPSPTTPIWQPEKPIIKVEKRATDKSPTVPIPNEPAPAETIPGELVEEVQPTVDPEGRFYLVRYGSELAIVPLAED